MNNNEYRINALPAKTWYQLNMNDTRLLWDDNLVPCDMDTKKAVIMYVQMLMLKITVI